MTLSDDKRREYQRLMTARNGQARSPIVAIPDPFAEYSMTDFENEVSILGDAGSAWNMQFCQATTGFLGRAGGCWIAYQGHEPRAVLHAELFSAASKDQKAVNFWAEYIMRGIEVAKTYRLPFVILARFSDGVFSNKFEKDALEDAPQVTVGTRIAKGAAYSDCTNLVMTFPMESFKQVSRVK